MYQQSIDNFTEKDLAQLTKNFEKNFTKFKLNKYSIKLDLTKKC